VLSLWHPQKPGFEVDLFVREPFSFADAYSRATVARLGASEVTVVSFDDLIEMKRQTGRPADDADIEALVALRRSRERRTD
jgi:hypothetical protein